LAVDGTQGLQVIGANLDGGFKEAHSHATVASLAEALTLQRELHARALQLLQAQKSQIEKHRPLQTKPKSIRWIRVLIKCKTSSGINQKNGLIK
jgi:hypothetical protein